MNKLSIPLVAAMLLVPVAAASQDLPYEPAFIELGLGATNIETTLGNGGLTAGVSRDGDVTMISWPSPSYFDHMHYLTSNAPDARQKPRFGASQSMGAFAGLAFQRQGTSATELSWFRDPSWQRHAAYLAKDVGVVETTFDNDALGITVRQLDLIPHDHDVFIRRFLVERDPTSPVDTAAIVSYENLSPNLSKIPQVPLLDALIDHKNDYLAVWQEAANAVMHFHPSDTGVVEAIGSLLHPIDRDFGPLGDLLEAEQPEAAAIDSVAGDLDKHYTDGVYIAVSSLPAPVSFQIGEDHTDTCAIIDKLADNIQSLEQTYPNKSLPAPPSIADLVRCGGFDPLGYPRSEHDWAYSAQDAFDDASDGELSGSRLAGGQVNAAIKFPLNFQDDAAQAAQIMAFGDTSQAAGDQLEWVRNQPDLQAIQDDVVSRDQTFVDGLWIPDEITGELRNFIQRAFLNIRVGTDRDTAAIVASVSRQPSYQLDWPRDGAFFNIALDLSGQHELVSRRMQFYSDAIRERPRRPTLILNKPVPGWPGEPAEDFYPPGSWEMNYYADGMIGGNIPLEIDNTALLVWSYVYHVGELDGQARANYIAEQWPTIERAAEWLYSWRDPETGLNWYANEDDHAVYTQGLQGASTTFGALVSAARLAKYLDKDDLADRWLHRAGELQAATLKYLYVDGQGFYGLRGPKKLGGGSPYWLSWPTHMLDKDDERFLPQLQKGLDHHYANVSGQTPGGQYPTKVAISAALVLPEGDQRDKAVAIATKLATDIANPDTYTIGEHFSALDTDADGQWDDGWINSVSTPHLWSMALVYLTAVAYHHPEAFDAYDNVLPTVEIPDVNPPTGGGDDAGDAGDVGDAGPSVDSDGPTADAGDASRAQPQSPPDANEGCGCGTGRGAALPSAVALLVLGLGALARRRLR